MTHDETTAAVRRGLLAEDAREVYKRPGGVGPNTCPRCGRTAHGLAPTAEGCPGCTLPTSELERIQKAEALLTSLGPIREGDALAGSDERAIRGALAELRAVLGSRQ